MAALHVGLGLALWLTMWHAGVSPALAGVAMGLLTPARPTQDWSVARDRGGELAVALAGDPRPPRLREMLREAGARCHWPSAWPTTCTR